MAAPTNGETKPKTTEELVVKLKELMMMDPKDRDALMNEFADNSYFKDCIFEDHIDTILFYLLNYSLSLKDMFSSNLVKMFGDLFAHEDHCFSITKHSESSCKISSKLFRSNWLKVYFESIAKIYRYNFANMDDPLLDLMYVLFKKSPNRQAINFDFTTALNSLISNTTLELAKKEKMGKKAAAKQPPLCEKKRKVVLLIILILDGQFQSHLDRKVLKDVASFLDTNGIRMYWQNLDQKNDAKGQVKEIVKFCRTLIETHRNARNEIEID